MAKKPKSWGNSISSIREAYAYADSIEDHKEAVAVKEEVIEYAYKRVGVPSHVLIDIIFGEPEEGNNG
jgi:hypothetical protein